MKNDVRYLGSVRFFKHLILFVTASVILLPTIVLVIILIQYWELKRNSDRIMEEQQLQISHLKEKMAYYEEQFPERDNAAPSEKEEPEPEQEQEKPGVQGISKIEEFLTSYAVDLEEIKYILVNDSHPLPQTFQLDLVETRNGQLVHREIKEPLEQMIHDAGMEGHELVICSAYRDYEKQAKLVENSIQKYMNKGYSYTEAYWKAGDYLEMVGRSEHHTGLAVDLVGIGYQALDEGQADTAESKWLHENAHKYGFILRYPENKEEYTGILHESWHFRYVGELAAGFIYENQLCLEEFYALLDGQK